MRAVIVGAGKACKSLIELIDDPVWKSYNIQLVSVVEHRQNAPGLLYAQKAGLKIFRDIKEALAGDEIELVIELTGDDAVLQELYLLVKPGMKIIDHTITKIFWDAVSTQADQRWQLIELEKLELEISNERIFLKSIFDGIADPAVVLDKNGVIIRANTKFIKFSNLSFDQVLNKECRSIIKVSGIDCSNKTCSSCISEMFEGGEPMTELLVVPPPDEAYWEKLRSPVFNSKNEVIAVLAIWHKIRDRIKLQQKIDVAESQFASFINSAKDWISIKDLAGRYLTVNPVIAAAFDMKKEDFINKTPEEILPVRLSKMV
ncbi:MAG: PAS domain-containing protein, partial [Candidatus Kapabacteria bacterium]|nr:PAS domain-containing protein [Candidatus Kapabacteria bacterium]